MNHQTQKFNAIFLLAKYASKKAKAHRYVLLEIQHCFESLNNSKAHLKTKGYVRIISSNRLRSKSSYN